MADRNGEYSPREYGPVSRRPSPLRTLVLLLVVLALAYPFYLWFIERVEVDANELLIVVNKTGRSLPDEVDANQQVVLYPALVAKLAAQTGLSPERVRNSFKGVQFEVFKEGRHFVNPIFHERIVRPTISIPDGKFGVLIRRYGRPLPPGQTLARAEDERGPVAGTLTPGRHALNPLAFDVKLFQKIVIPEGWIGVQTYLSGRNPADANAWVMATGERGLQPDTLGPGTYFDKNPYEVRVDLVDMRSQKYDMLADDAIEFPSNDGFNVRMEATVEWALQPDQAPWVVVKIGDLEDVVTKVIRPYAMSLARIQGSKLTAREFIGARETFQKRLFDDLFNKCRPQGVLIKAVTVRDLKPPERVRSIIRERELADQTMTRFENEITEAIARAQLVEQQELATQQQALGDANREVVSVTVEAEQQATVAITAARQRLDVARLELEAARKQAEALLARGQAAAKVIEYEYAAQAVPLRDAVAAFGDGYTYAQNHFYQKVAPAIQSVLSNTEGPFADVFKQFQKQGSSSPVADATKSAERPNRDP